MNAAREENDSKRALISWAFYDWGTGAYSVLIQTFVFATYFVQRVAPNKDEGAAVWGITIGVVSLFIALCGPFVGALADQGGHRKAWLAACTLLCAGSCFFSWFILPDPSLMTFAMSLLCLGTIGSEFAYVFYNAMLPEIAPADKIGRWSGWGWGMGYAGGTVSLIIALYAFIFTGHAFFELNRFSAEDVRASFVLAGAWILLFSLPLFLFTPNEKKASTPLSTVIQRSFSELYNTLSNLRQYKQITRFFIARMLYTDGLTTLFAFGGIYAATEFDFTETEILIFGIGLNITAGLGAALFAILDDFWGSREVIMTSLIALIVLSAFALYTNEAEGFWMSGLALGMFVGPIQASSRSYLARRAPAELRNQMFGFFAMTGRATAFLGPTLVGWGTYISGDLTLGMSVIILFYLLGLGLVWTLPKKI